MNFINDLITDEDRKRFDFSVFKRPTLFTEPIYSPRRWTVDRDAGVFLIWLRGGNEEERRAVHFSLWWKSTNIEMKLAYDFHGPNSLTWTKSWIDVPEHLSEQMPEIYAVIKEALIVYQLDGEASRLFNGRNERPLDEIKFEF